MVLCLDCNAQGNAVPFACSVTLLWGRHARIRGLALRISGLQCLRRWVRFRILVAHVTIPWARRLMQSCACVIELRRRRPDPASQADILLQSSCRIGPNAGPAGSPAWSPRNRLRTCQRLLGTFGCEQYKTQDWKRSLVLGRRWSCSFVAQADVRQFRPRGKHSKR